MKKFRILVHPSDKTGVGYFRSVTPHIALERNYPDLFAVDIDHEPRYDDDQWLSKYDMVHFHRAFGPFEKMAETMERLKRLGIVAVMDIDDYWAPGSHHPAYHIIKANELDKKILSNLKLSPHVTTTTKLFADEIRKYNKNVSVIPNAADPNDRQFVSNPEPSERLRVAFLGGSSHLYDLRLLQGMVSQLQSDGLLDKLQFVLCGFDLRGNHTEIDPVTKEQRVRPIKPTESVWYLYEKIFTDDYRSVSPRYRAFLERYVKDEYDDLANEPYRRVWTKPVTSYATNYNTFDVSLAPLVENTFNSVKSELKLIEAGVHNKIIIAQDFGPYKVLKNALPTGGAFDETGNSILVDSKHNHKGWYKAIKKLVTNPEMVETLRNNLNQFVMETYSMDVVTEKRKEIYLGLLQNEKK